MLTDSELRKWMGGKTKMLVTAVRLPEVFIKEGRRMAKQEGISLSHFMRRAMSREFLSRKDKP